GDGPPSMAWDDLERPPAVGSVRRGHSFTLRQCAEYHVVRVRSFAASAAGTRAWWRITLEPTEEQPALSLDLLPRLWPAPRCDAALPRAGTRGGDRRSALPEEDHRRHRPRTSDGGAADGGADLLQSQGGCLCRRVPAGRHLCARGDGRGETRHGERVRLSAPAAGLVPRRAEDGRAAHADRARYTSGDLHHGL